MPSPDAGGYSCVGPCSPGHQKTMGLDLQTACTAQTCRLPGTNIHVAPTDKVLPMLPTLPLPILPWASVRVHRREWVVLAIFFPQGEALGEIYSYNTETYYRRCSLASTEAPGSSKCFIEPTS